MLYVLAIICPPLAVLLCGKPVRATLNLLLTLLLWLPGIIHAWVVVAHHYADKRTDRVVSAIQSSRPHG